MELGEADYGEAGLERLADSELLLARRRFSGSVYFAGRAVESILRAILWRNDPDVAQGRKALDTGHDLRKLLAGVRDLGVLSEREQRGGQLTVDVQHIARLWHNNLRFWPDRKLGTHWRSLGEVTRKRSLELAVREFVEACASVVKRCYVIWQS